MATITINSNLFSGDNISVVNGKVFIDGNDVTLDAREIHISVQGDVQSIDVGTCNDFEVIGNVGKVRTGSGDLKCDNITGGVQTGSGGVECDSINGDVQTGSGDVSATTITGSVKTGSGHIKYRK
jgi:hypothetical protein